MTPYAVYQDVRNVLQFPVADEMSGESFSEFCSVTDDANSNAWQLAVRNARMWFEDVLDDHPTRRLFNISDKAADEGLMVEQHVNPLAAASNKDAVAAYREKVRLEKEANERRSREVAQAAILMAANKNSRTTEGTPDSAATRMSRSQSRERGVVRSASRDRSMSVGRGPATGTAEQRGRSPSVERRGVTQKAK